MAVAFRLTVEEWHVAELLSRQMGLEIAAAGITSDQQGLKELVAAFDQAEIAVQEANLEALGKITTTMVSGA